MDEEGYLSEANLLRIFGHDKSKTVDLIAYGELRSAYFLKIRVTSATQAAVDHVNTSLVLLSSGEYATGHQIQVGSVRGKEMARQRQDEYNAECLARDVKKRRIATATIEELVSVPILNLANID